MTYVISGKCCNDASCVSVCPVDCIHPTPAEREFGSSDMLYIDPETCIECGSCVAVCPVDAIFSEDRLPEESRTFLDINAAFYANRTPQDFAVESTLRPRSVNRDRAQGLRVAIVGSGPAAGYAANALLQLRGVEVNVFERLLTPNGLLRFGVAPDHADTKKVSRTFPFDTARPGCRLHLGVNVGTDISHAELLEYHHAVIYAVGADGDREMGIAGEDLPGSHSARDFVAWYNGHPDHVTDTFDLTGERAVVVGNGNVALDVARILLTDPDRLANTDIADHALAALRKSAVREVVLLGRRGPAQAAFTLPEFLALCERPDIDVVAIPDEVEESASSATAGETIDPIVKFKTDLILAAADHHESAADRRLILRFLQSPAEVIGERTVEGLRIVRNELVSDGGNQPSARPTSVTETIDTSLVFRSIGYFGRAVPDLPFDPVRGTVSHRDGRVHTSDDTPLRGTYVTGWVKRGPRGVVGTNRVCAEETVASLVDDYVAGALESPTHDTAQLEQLILERKPDRIDHAGWARIDAAERLMGEESGRPRVKFTSNATILAHAQDCH
ncbi:4Fe-4S binding protein [Rhodococcus sp. NPDC003382]